MRHTLVIVGMGLLLAACGLTAPDMKAYQGDEIADSQLAIVWNWDCPFCVDSIKKDGFVYFDYALDGLRKRIRLKPAAYEIAYSYLAFETPMVERRSDTIELEAGHTYEIKDDSCYRCRTYLWIEDSATGRVVGGFKPSR